jgi:hypothetical protein
MGQPSIEHKLSLEFKKDIVDESQVVYILVETRKLLEHDNAKSQYQTINFYRNWAVHTKLALSALADELVGLFDDYISSNNKTASNRLETLIKPTTLRDELTTFLAVHNLTFPSCTDDILWKRFVKLLAGVIEDAPLHYLPPKKTATVPTKYVKSITVSRSRNKNGRAMLTWKADCHTQPPPGVDTSIKVVMLAGIDVVHLP